MCKKRRYIHVIVAPSPWEEDPLRYRRHRLLSFFCEKYLTLWISPSMYGGFSLCKKPGHVKNEKGIVHINVPDKKGIVSHMQCLQSSLRSEIKKYYKDDTNNLVLWYTCPIFSGLRKMGVWDAIIYDCSDRWTEAEHLQKIKKWMIARSERNIVKSANICFASSSHLQDYLTSIGRNDVTLIENGVDLYRFTNFQQKVSLSDKPVLGFVGGLKPWKVDFNLLLKIATAKPKWDLVLVGSTYDPMPSIYYELIQLPNVKKHDPVPIDKIPAYIQSFDVGLLPYLSNEYNRGVFPLKFFEYLACGVSIVGCGLPSTSHYEEKQVYEQVPAETQDFLTACQRAINSRHTNIERRQTIAKTADWNEKFRLMWKQVRSYVEQ